MSEGAGAPAAAAQTATVLCVDDESNILSALRRLFRPDGYRVLTATGGAEGLQLLESEAVDLVISDMRMPEMMGNSMIAMIDLYPPLAGMPVIMVTGVSKLEIDDAGIPPEIPVLFKPVDFEKLAAEINKIVNRKGGAGV